MRQCILTNVRNLLLSVHVEQDKKRLDRGIDYTIDFFNQQNVRNVMFGLKCAYTKKTGVSNFDCQNVDSQFELLDSTTLSPKFFLFSQGYTHLIFCLTVTRGSESL